MIPSRILALDLATKTGWCVSDRETGYVASGVIDATPAKPRKGQPPPHPGRRFDTFLDALFAACVNPYTFEAIIFEDVKRNAGRSAALVYCGLLAITQATAYRQRVPCIGVGVYDVKRAAVGKARATKNEMIAAANEAWPDVDIIDDNEADAMWLAEAAWVAYGNVDNAPPAAPGKLEVPF